MTKVKKTKFIPEACDCCGQTKNYIMRLGKGQALTMLAIYNAVIKFNRNNIHPQKEMVLAKKSYNGTYMQMVESGFITPTMNGNMSNLRFHGLIAYSDHKSAGRYLITNKGMQFLRGEAVNKTVIVSKVNDCNEGYHAPDGLVTINSLLKKDAVFWDIPVYSEIFDKVETF